MSAYRSRFEHWDAQAWVRSKPRRDTAFAPGLHFFSPNVCPPLAHPEVRALPPQARERLLVHHLYLYLEFTVQLETGPVNDACLLLRSPDFLPWLPARMRADALRIYTDEAGHAEMSHTLLAEVRDATGVEPIAHRPQFLRELEQLYAEPGESDQAMLTLFFVIVSETLITGSLSRLPRDRRVQARVREFAADHAADEGRHHAYFRQLLEFVWPRLPAAVRRRTGVLLPRMMAAFLDPDRAMTASILADCGVRRPAETAAEVCAAPYTRAMVREGARPSVRMFRANGVLDDPVVAAAFTAHGMPTGPGD